MAAHTRRTARVVDLDLPGAFPTEEFQGRLLEVNDSLQDYSYAAEAYDATILAALAAVKGGATDGETIQAKPGTYVFIPPGVPHNIANTSDKPARMIMTVSPPGHEQYFEELVKLVTKGGPPDADAIARLRARFDTEQLSALTTDQVQLGSPR